MIYLLSKKVSNNENMYAHYFYDDNDGKIVTCIKEYHPKKKHQLSGSHYVTKDSEILEAHIFLLTKDISLIDENIDTNNALEAEILKKIIDKL